MILIFDSYDCTGKTTYANKMVTSGWQAYHGSTVRPGPDSAHRIWTRACLTVTVDFLSQVYVNSVVFDRFIMTEYCYSPVMRKYQISYYDKLEQQLLQGINRILWVFPDIEDISVLEQRYHESGEDFLTFEQLLKVRGKFKELFNKSQLPKLSINVENYSDIDKNIETILKHV